MNIFGSSRSERVWDKVFAATGLLGPLVAFTAISISITYSPWFSWSRNALSDLGHATRSSAAPVFNLGLTLAGILLIIYCVTNLYKKTVASWFTTSLTGFFLVLIAVFDEIYGWIHFVVSVLFFITGTFTALIFYLEKKNPLAVMGFIISAGTWLLYYYLPKTPLHIGVRVGIAVPEFISSIAISAWIMWESLVDLLGQE